ncbi:TlpA family protein disulfide reductase [Thalassotalea fusca]
MKKLIVSILFLTSVYLLSKQFGSSGEVQTVDSNVIQQALDAHEKTTGKKINLSHNLLSLNGTETKLSTFSGKPLVVMFWATWCKACEMQLPKMVEQQELTPEANFIYIAVRSNDEEIMKVNRSLGDKMAIYRKGWQSDESILSGNSLPLTFVIDENGVIVAEKLGFSTEDGVSFIHDALSSISATAAL